MRFYFHVRRGSEVLQDKAGIDLPNVRAALSRALRDARIFIDQGKVAGRVGEYRIDIADETLSTIASIPLCEVAPLSEVVRPKG